MGKYLVSDETAQWIRETRGQQGAGNRRQYLPRFQSHGGGGSVDSAKILEITGGNALAGFAVRIYDNYKQYSRGESMGTGTYFPTEIGMGGTLPAGLIVIGHPVQLKITGGSES